MPTFTEIPDVKVVSVLAREQQFWVHAIFHHVWRAPLAGHGNIVAKVPREIVAELLWAAFDLPSPEGSNAAHSSSATISRGVRSCRDRARIFHLGRLR